MDTGAASTRLTNEDCTPYTIHHTYDTYALANGTGQRRGEAGRRHLVLPHCRLCLRPLAGEGHRGRGEGQRRQGAGRGAPSAERVRLLLVPAAGAGVQGQDRRVGQRRRRHHQLHQGGQRVRPDQDPDPGRAAGVHQRHPQPRPAGDAGDVRHRGLVLGPERRDPQVEQALLRQDEEDADHDPGRRVLRGDHVPQRGEGDRHATMPTR